MQFAGDWRTALRNVPAWKRNPESEDIWLATEDYWVQREMLLALDGVNKDAAKTTDIRPTLNAYTHLIPDLQHEAATRLDTMLGAADAGKLR